MVFVPFGLALPVLLLAWLAISVALGGESVAWTKLEMLGIVCAACGAVTGGAAETVDLGDSIIATGAVAEVGVI